MQNRKKSGTAAGILPALAAAVLVVCTACGAEETNWAAMNLASSDAFLQETFWQETLVYDVAETTAQEVRAAAKEAEDAIKETTAQEELQIYPVRDFLVDEEHGLLYTKIAKDDGFERVQRMSFTEKNGHMQDSEQEILNPEQAEKMLCGAYDGKMGNGENGMPELIDGWVIEELEDYEDSRKIEIFAIFAYQDGMAEMVYLDENDGMEFLFITAGGDLVYEWGVSGGPAANVFRRCTFDLKWNREYLDTLVRYSFPEVLDEDESLEKEREYYRTYYPDTYGVGGSGVYCLRERRKTAEELQNNEDGQYTVREYLTEEEFLKMYEEWTGWDFYKAQYMY